MRNNYYDSGWNWTPGAGEAKGQPIKPMEAKPYGEVYGNPQTASPGAGSLPALAPAASNQEEKISARQEQLDVTPSMGKRGPRRVKRGRTGLPGFLLCLVLLVGLTVGVICLKGGVELYMPEGILGTLWEAWGQWDAAPGLPDLPNRPGLPDRDDSDGWDKFFFELEDDWTHRLPDTTIPKASTGSGTVLAISPMADESLSPQSIYEKVNPTVVGIQVEHTMGYTLGSGVILSADGYIVTNAHVIAGGRQAEVLLEDGTILDAALVGYDKSYDLAVLKVRAPGNDLPVAEFGDSDLLRVGDPAWAIGNPLGMELRGTMTDGMVSAINREVTADNGIMTLIQTTAALNSGNSGGALINAAGQVVGITNMKMMATDETIEGLGFAIPSQSVKAVVDQIIAQGYYDDGVPLLGVTVYTVLPSGKTPGGACVQSVEPASDAYKQGVRPGDIIISAGGQAIEGIDDLLAIKNALGVGDTLTLEIWRPAGVVTVEITLMTRHQMDEAE